jgi:methyl-accepting chemotaxis protein
MIELHFGIFVCLAFLLCYRDWRPIALAAAVTAVHHLSFNAVDLFELDQALATRAA